MAELTGEAVVFNQRGGQGDTVSLTAFFTKENHGERTLLIFLCQKSVVSFLMMWSIFAGQQELSALCRFSVTIQNAVQHVRQIVFIARTALDLLKAFFQG